MIAGVFVTAIFWLIHPTNPPTNFHNQESQVVKTTRADKVTVKPAMQRTAAKLETVKPVGETAKVAIPAPTGTEGHSPSESGILRLDR